MPAPGATADRPYLLIAVLVAVAALAGLVRELGNLRVPERPADLAAGWFSVDPDGLYHARRLERALSEGRVDGRDALLNHPAGAAIPWPPYYTLALRVLLGPFVPSPVDDQARRAWIERAVASAPAGFAVLTALVAALAAWRLAGPAAGACAGASFACLGASLDYSAPGIGDHHAWATLLAAVAFALTAACFAPAAGRARTARGAALLGALAGLAAGLLLGSWVGGLVQIALIQATLGSLMLVNARRAVPGLAPFGLAFHLALALAVLPAVLASPWRETDPWMMINLSWFHLAQPLLGALACAPLLALAPGTAGARRYPWFLAAALGVAGLVLAASELELARALRAGLAWAGRDNSFMAYITESQPLLWGQIGGPGALHGKLGYSVWLAVPAWCAVAWRALRGEHGLALWAVALPPMLWQALLQRRFAEVCGVPLAVVLGIGAGALLALLARSWPARRPAAAAALGLLLGALGQWPTLESILSRARAGQHVAGGPAIVDQRSYRALLRWIGDHTPAGSGVLAAWELGHAIEWVAQRPTVATNFGSYVGAEGYLAPWRFFLEEDPAAAEALLAEREARYVLILGRFSNDLEVMLRLVRPGERGQFVWVPSGGAPRPAPRWFGTMSARLMLEGKIGDPAAGQLVGDSLDFARLVHVSPQSLRMPMAIPHTDDEVPAGWVWERVPGARLVARGAPGEELELRIDVDYPAAGRKLLWSARAKVGGDGLARLRVPYASDEPNGDGLVGAVRWSLGARSGVLAIPAAAVLSGAEVALP